MCGFLLTITLHVWISHYYLLYNLVSSFKDYIKRYEKKVINEKCEYLNL